ncbi:MAG: DUF2953 domain-containing protein [Clostridiales bacterium]|nr:DUF2953 domain-containing protein [Clostridiales bacterium]
MIGLIISACLLLLITLLLSLRLYFVAEIGDELKFYAKILFIKFTIYPEKEKAIRISDYSYKRFARKKRRQMKKRARALAKQRAAKPKEPVAPKRRTASDLIEIIKLLLSLFKIFLPRFLKHLRIEIARIKITVGGSDPAATAITYGIIAQLTAYLLEYLDNITNIKSDQNTEISVDADFISEHTTYDIHFIFSLRIWHMLDIGIRLAYNYLKDKPEFAISERSENS